MSIKFRPTTILLSIFLLIVIALLFFPNGLMPYLEGLYYRRMVVQKLSTSKSISLIEFQHYRSRADLILNEKQASPSQSAALHSILGQWLVAIPDGLAGCFDPHHRIVFIDKNSVRTKIDICFHCGNIEIEDQREIQMPEEWKRALEALFTEAGMPPLQDYSPLIAKHPEYPLPEEELLNFSKEIKTSTPKSPTPPKYRQR